MTNNGIVNIHGKSYMTVAGRLELAKNDILRIETEVLKDEPVVIRAIVTIRDKGEFYGTSSANPSKSIEASNPYEVAETSAVGRALGFAGYGVIEGIASADEMVKAEPSRYDNRTATPASKYASQKTHYCETHQRDLKMRELADGIVYDHRLQIDGVWNICYGNGKWLPQKPYVKEVSEEDISIQAEQ